MSSPVPSYRESHLGRGVDYHDRFTRNCRRRMMWQIEQGVLDRVLDRFDEPGCEPAASGTRPPIDYLDFACGTGRVLAFVSARTASATGIDVSGSMLDVAKTTAPSAELVMGDITHESNTLDGRTFDLITAFRFFPNAEPSLRTEAMQALVSHLKPEGRLVFNNHRCLSSLRKRLVRGLTLGRRGRSGMTRDEAEQLVTSGGLEIERIEHAGVIPEYERLILRPRWIVERVEYLATRLPLAGIAENLVYVCRRPAAAAAAAADRIRQAA